MPENTDLLDNIPDYTITRRARGVWKKFGDWYGADAIVKHFGKFPPREWCEAIDSIPSRDAMEKIFSDMRQKHVTFPPRFPEFDCIVAKHCRAKVSVDGPTMQERLGDYVLRHKAMTRMQLRQPWTYVYRGPRSERDVVGVVIPQCWETGAEGFRVLVEDMQLSTED